MDVSVVMTTYNGELYIEKQISSILKNLRKEDEFIISDDGSTDKTLQIIKEKQKNDKRIRLIKGPQKGPKQNFESAIKCASKDIIVLSDQDDIWEDNKIEKIIETFEMDSKIMLVTHNAKLIDSKDKEIKEPLFVSRNSRPGILKNIYKNAYYGCCMAFRKELKQYIFPFPKLIYMHDQWIGLIGEVVGKSVFIEENLIYYRRHDNNVTRKKNNLIVKLYRRCMISFFLIIRIIKIKIGRRKNDK